MDWGYGACAPQSDSCRIDDVGTMRMTKQTMTTTGPAEPTWTALGPSPLDPFRAVFNGFRWFSMSFRGISRTIPGDAALMRAGRKVDVHGEVRATASAVPESGEAAKPVTCRRRRLLIGMEIMQEAWILRGSASFEGVLLKRKTRKSLRIHVQFQSTWVGG